MNIAYRVQHTFGRDVALERVLSRLPPAVEVITDHEGGIPNPFRTYLRCLAGAPSHATHLCIVQDDALPCQRFVPLLEEAVGERPDDVLSLFVGGLPGRTRKDFLAAQGQGDRWSSVYFREIHHVVALLWPVPLAEEFLAWYESDPRIPVRKPHRSDDAIVGYWARTAHRLFWATVPCLVEHPDDLPSIAQNPGRTLGDKGRKAIAFIDDLA